MGPSGWPEVNKATLKKVKSIRRGPYSLYTRNGIRVGPMRATTREVTGQPSAPAIDLCMNYPLSNCSYCFIWLESTSLARKHGQLPQ